MLPEVPFPWQDSQWQRLAQQYEERLLPHAFLVCGDQGLGKSLFVSGFSRYMLCQNPLKQFACGICRNCQQAGEDFSHPDVLQLAPLEGKRDINVEQIRSLTDFIVHTSHAGIAKIVIIDAAHHFPARPQPVDHQSQPGKYFGADNSNNEETALDISSHPDPSSPGGSRNVAERAQAPLPIPVIDDRPNKSNLLQGAPQFE